MRGRDERRTRSGAVGCLDEPVDVDALVVDRHGHRGEPSGSLRRSRSPGQLGSSTRRLVWPRGPQPGDEAGHRVGRAVRDDDVVGCRDRATRAREVCGDRGAGERMPQAIDDRELGVGQRARRHAAPPRPSVRAARGGGRGRRVRGRTAGGGTRVAWGGGRSPREPGTGFGCLSGTRVADPTRDSRKPSATSCPYASVTTQRETPSVSASTRLGGRAAPGRDRSGVHGVADRGLESVAQRCGPRRRGRGASPTRARASNRRAGASVPLDWSGIQVADWSVCPSR